MRRRSGFRQVLDAHGKTVGYLTSSPQPAPNEGAESGTPMKTAGQAFWGAYYRVPVSVKRAKAS
jgi:hypothetical protein